MTQTHTVRPAALVTGARRGIGKGICLALARKGYDIVINDITHDADMDNTVAELAREGARTEVVIADVADPQARADLAERAWQAFGSLNCLVNNAGISVKVRGDILDVGEAGFDTLISVNLKAMFFLTQDIARRMIADEAPRGSRTIVSISSANALFASVERAEYCLSKTGISMATKLFALRLANTDIRVYEIRPGIIETDMTRVVKAKYDQRIADGLTPIQRFGTADEVGLAVATLAEGAFPFSTGDALHIDGGLHIPHF
ncbi:MAG: 3-ketoacyl-ACP reductase [Alcaligenaceae bacterium]|nr:3-ketoacyl-ACP reductase [Alcaligenaceae bacterium]